MLKVNIDKFVRGALRKNAPPYNEEMWRGIEERLDAMEEPVPVKTAPWLWPFLAVTVVLSGITGYYIGRTSGTGQGNAYHNAAARLAPSFNAEPAFTVDKSSAGANKTVLPEIADAQNPQGKTATVISSRRPLAINGFRKNNTDSKLARYSSASSNSAGTALLIPSVFAKSKVQGISMPVFFASVGKQEIAAAPMLELGTRENSLAIIAKEEGRASGPADLEGILYNFRDNAAFTGSEAKFNFNTRANLYSFNELYHAGANYSAAFDARIDKINSAVGVYATRDITSFTGLNSLGLAYSYKLPLGEKGALRLGIGGNVSHSTEYFPSHYDTRAKNGNYILAPQGDALDLGNTYYAAHAGLWLDYNNVIAGLSVKNLNSPLNGESGMVLPVYTMNLGYKTAIGRNFQLLPMAEITMTNSIFYNKFSLLASYKNCIMGGLTWQNDNPLLPGQSLGLYAGAGIKRMLIFSTFGQSIARQQEGFVKYNYIQAGIKYRIW